MLDLTGIVFSSVMMLIVIIRALRLDRSEPWFQTVKPQDDKKPRSPKVWQRKL